MSEQAEVRAVSPAKSRLRRFGAMFSIIATVLYVWFFFGEVYEHYHAGGNGQETRVSGDSVLDTMQQQIEGQLRQLKAVDPMAMMNVYERTLETSDCNWMFQCQSPVVTGRFSLAEIIRRETEPQPEVKLLYHVAGPIFVPTGRTIRGTPHALAAMIGRIGDAGGWAVTMFISCGIIYFALLAGIASEKGSGLVVYTMVLGSLLGISVMVMGMQWFIAEVLKNMGAGFAMLAQLMAPSGALALLVGIPHVLKAPKEVEEAAQELKAV